ncbi:MAG: glycosyltransferase family 2 protein [Candidatus Electrothrix scaldis]|nr:MAG: glycosyltransferase family 2 protein [Candidatus Electrothrix sp. GW3-3]
MKLSILIPAHNEEDVIYATVSDIVKKCNDESICHEVIVVDDNSFDKTPLVLKKLSDEYGTVKFIRNEPPNGFGFAIKKGLKYFSGDAVAIVMADQSDFPDDIVKYYKKMEEGYDCVFGSRFIKKGFVIDYPIHKLIINRFANFFIKLLFSIHLNDTTNAFKCYRREVIEGIQPILSHHFNITVELPLKAIVRGYSYDIVPIGWKNRTSGISKLKIKEMGGRYLFIVLYVFLEKYLSNGDYIKKTESK